MAENVDAGAVSDTTDAPPVDEQQTFDADYVKSLRDEAVKHRHEKKAADSRAQEALDRLLSARVEALGSDMADPSDLLAQVDKNSLFDEDGFPDDEAIKTAMADLLDRKPHLRTRDARGDIDQGGRGEQVDSFSFNDWLKNAAY